MILFLFLNFKIKFHIINIFFSSDCCYVFALCGVIEVLYFIEKKERIQLSVQDIYNHLIHNESNDKDGCSLRSTFDFISEKRCVLSKTCPYEGIFKPIAPVATIIIIYCILIISFLQQLF